MTHILAAAVLLWVTLGHPEITSGQSQGAPPARRPQRAAPAKPQPPLTLKQVIESLSSTRSSSRVEDLISKRGIQFQGNPEILVILKEFGAGPKLLAMIPMPAPPPAPPAPKVAGALTVVCEPKDCMVIVDDMYKGKTSENRKTLSGLRIGDATVEVFAEGYEEVVRKVELHEGQPLEEKFVFKRNDLVRQQNASALLMRSVASIGSIDGLAELTDIEGSGTMQWLDNTGQTQEWAMTFNKGIGKDIVMTFKTRNGQCTASISTRSTKQDCNGELKRAGESIAGQAASLFLSYQLQDIIQELLKRTLITSESDENRLESNGDRDSYVLTVGDNSLPVDLVYRISNTNAPIHVQYSDYLNLEKARFPGKIAVGRLDSKPVWLFSINSVKSRTRLTRSQ